MLLKKTVVLILSVRWCRKNYQLNNFLSLLEARPLLTCYTKGRCNEQQVQLISYFEVATGLTIDKEALNKQSEVS